jgi:hypothetical protein
VLAALHVPVESQLLVFSPTSLQKRLINEQNPRAIYFNDRLALGWVRDGDLIEIAAHDRRQGVVFYTLDQRPSERPQFTRAFVCLGCHVSGDTLGVPGMLMFSTSPRDGERFGAIRTVDQRSALRERWGGWFVTGRTGAAEHLGNRVTALDGKERRELDSVDGLFDTDGYPARSSDAAALLAFSHQTHMTNLLTRASWEARAADPALHPGFAAGPEQEELVAQMLAPIAAEVVDYMLFVDEAPLPRAVEPSSAFARTMASAGVRDRQGRSLHDLDLTQRLLKYPCSYLIYSAAFDALPAAIKQPIYARLWHVLSGQEAASRYRAALTLRVRQAIVEILRDTKKDLPRYFAGAIR